MIKKIQKNWLMWLVVGIVVLAAGIVSLIMDQTKGHPFIPLGTKGAKMDLILLLSGVLVTLLGIYYVLPATKSGRKGFVIAYWVEFVVILIIALLGFFIPFVYGMINKSFPVSITGGLVTWLGIICYVHGVIQLAECAFSSPSGKKAWFVFGIASVTLGTYLFFRGLNGLNKAIEIAVVWGLIVAGALLFVIAIMGAQNKKGKKSKKDSK